jgi:hypothetical protein
MIVSFYKGKDQNQVVTELTECHKYIRFQTVLEELKCLLRFSVPGCTQLLKQIIAHLPASVPDRTRPVGFLTLGSGYSWPHSYLDHTPSALDIKLL